MPLRYSQFSSGPAAWVIVSLLSFCIFTGERVAAAEPAVGSQLVFLGTYTRGGKSEGIYVCRLDLATGELKDLKLAAKTKNPSFLAVHPSGKHLYSVSEIADFEGKKTGAVSSFAYGALTLCGRSFQTLSTRASSSVGAPGALPSVPYNPAET